MMSNTRVDIGVIFDMDGVLLDSFQAHFESWKHVAAEHGFNLTRDQFATDFGRTSREVIAETWGRIADSPERVKAIDARKEGLYRTIIQRTRPIMPGAIELIDGLRSAGIRLAIGSSGPPPNIQVALDLIGRRSSFQAIVTGADVQRGKPDPQVFLVAADRLGLDPGCCVVIEDAPVGVQAAHNAGMATIALVSTGRKTSDFDQDRPELIIHALCDLNPADIRGLAASRASTRD